MISVLHMMPLKIREDNKLFKSILLVSIFLRFWDFSIHTCKAAKIRGKANRYGVRSNSNLVGCC